MNSKQFILLYREMEKITDETADIMFNERKKVYTIDNVIILFIYRGNSFRRNLDD